MKTTLERASLNPAENVEFCTKTTATKTFMHAPAKSVPVHTGAYGSIGSTGKTASPTKHAVHLLRYAGRKWRLYKRSSDPDAKWYLT